MKAHRMGPFEDTFFCRTGNYEIPFHPHSPNSEKEPGGGETRPTQIYLFESPLDTFGPATYDKDAFGFSARELVPAEVPARSLYGDNDPMAAPWEPPNKLMQQWIRESDDRVRSR